MLANSGHRYTAKDGIPGGYGGDAVSYNSNAGGGTGILGGKGIGSQGTNGNNGTGGLIIVYSNSIINNGEIEAKGMEPQATYGTVGGASGGGSINIFYTDVYSGNNAVATGGKRIKSIDYNRYGGKGRRWFCFL